MQVIHFTQGATDPLGTAHRVRFVPLARRRGRYPLLIIA